MRVPRFIFSLAQVVESTPSTSACAADDLIGKSLVLSRSESRHLAKVLRLEAGTTISLHCNELAESFSGVVTKCDRESSQVRIDKRIANTSRNSLTLLLGMPKNSACEIITEKSVELGVEEIAYFFAERSQNHVSAQRFEKRLERLERIALSAVKQSYSSYCPRLRFESNLEKTLLEVHSKQRGAKATERRLLCSAPQPGNEILGVNAIDGQTQSEPPLITEYLISSGLQLKQAQDLCGSGLEKFGESVDLYLLIGPEGGFTPKELSIASEFDYQSVSLGSTVLRSETAAILACGITAFLR